jgi:cyclopropane fatty-acyl-phospholipid synthase-like methyltransferase
MGLAGLRNLFGARREPPAGLPGVTAELPAMDAPVTEAAPPPRAAPLPVWHEQRVALAEELWGEGFLGPGGAEEILRLAAPMGLSAASSLLLLGVGAGGPARVLAAELGVWVSACESDPVLVELATRRVRRAGAALAKRAEVEQWNPGAPQFRRQGYHHALLMEALRSGRPPATLRAVAEAIKPGGQLVLVETVAGASQPGGDPDSVAWARLEHRLLALPREAAVTQALQGAGLDVRVVEDLSRRHARQALQGWQTLVAGLSGPMPSTARAAAMVAEAELWLLRLRLLRAGRIRLVRWHAMA